MFRSRMSRHAIMAFFLSWVIVPFAMANSFTLPALPYAVDARNLLLIKRPCRFTIQNITKLTLRILMRKFRPIRTLLFELRKNYGKYVKVQSSRSQ